MGTSENHSMKEELKNEEGKNKSIMRPSFIPFKILYKVMKALCKIKIETKEGIDGLGFFLKYSNSKKFIIACYHIINPTLENEIIEIEIYNKNIMKLQLNNRFIKYIDKPKDITILEIKESDIIYKDVEFLNYDMNYLNGGYNIYKDAYIFTIEHPFGGAVSCASGKIIDIFNNNEFEHNIATDKGSSGCPILLLNNNINLIQVIGINKERINAKNMNINNGIFIGDILNREINNNNIYIICEIYIKYEDVNKNIRIINSYEEYLKNGNDKDKLLKNEKYNNEEEIKKCKIKINDELIPFNYFYKFKSKGKYIIEYIFHNNLKNLCVLFAECKSIINIDFSNFNSNKAINMNGMFYKCSSLTNINFSNFNTNNVINMNGMFYGCSSLTYINLSNFNTINVTNMGCMFYECTSLISINLSNFNTNNVKYMNALFYGCESLKRENIITKDKRILKMKN